MKLSIIIVSWNVKDHVNDCINSIKKYPSKYTFEIIVVDNHSADGTVELLQQHHPEIKIIANQENHGFGRANNQGAKIAEGEYLFILNPDTLFLEGTINKLIDFMDSHPDIAMCGPKVMNENGSVQRSVRHFQTWKAAFCRYSILKHFGIFKSDLNHWRWRDFNYEQQGDVEQLIGAALLIKKKTFDFFGGFDERFFMYYEEVDLCYRIHLNGQRNVYYPGAELVHIGGRSSSQIPAKKQFMILQSLVSYLKKYTKGFKGSILSGLFKFGVLTLQIYDLLFYFIVFLLAGLFVSNKKRDKFKNRFIAAYDFLTKYYISFLRV
ncbi:MAG: glycosyltransferase family 2 protein [Pseudomonadales bacterium]|nr:glycosyltransferase family 2 protein [Pseudomonadales bacterium]